VVGVVLPRRLCHNYATADGNAQRVVTHASDHTVRVLVLPGTSRPAHHVRSHPRPCPCHNLARPPVNAPVLADGGLIYCVTGANPTVPHCRSPPPAYTRATAAPALRLLQILGSRMASACSQQTVRLPRREWRAAAACGGLAILCFLNTLRGGLVQDDEYAIVRVSGVQSRLKRDEGDGDCLEPEMSFG